MAGLKLPLICLPCQVLSPTHVNCWFLSSLVHMFGSWTKSECNWALLALWTSPMMSISCETGAFSVFSSFFVFNLGETTYFIFTEANCGNLNLKKIEINDIKDLISKTKFPNFLLIFFCSLGIFIYLNCIWRSTERNCVISHDWMKIKNAQDTQIPSTPYM